MKALIVNRIGDFGLSLGIFAIFFVFGAVDYSTVFATVTDLVNTTSKLIFFNMEFDILTVICFFLFIGAVGKSAQIGLHTWLPDAMEGLLSRALLKLHYMREHPRRNSKISWSTQ
jgi:NADH:ubiquinone oxidoreductase subunit 5 (subunit L)/multisubunit Na+/H+ antiporter MnhA subunit